MSEAELRALESLEVEVEALQARLDQERQRTDAALEREHSALSEATGSMMSRIEALEQRTAAADRPDALAPRIDALERDLADVDRRARMGDELAKALNRYQERHRAEPETDEDGRVDVNAASFEDLRALGLSVTQAARLIAMRDARGGFTTADEIAELPGTPGPQLDELVGKIRIGES